MANNDAIRTVKGQFRNFHNSNSNFASRRLRRSPLRCESCDAVGGSACKHDDRQSRGLERPMEFGCHPIQQLDTARPFAIGPTAKTPPTSTGYRLGHVCDRASATSGGRIAGHATLVPRWCTLPAGLLLSSRAGASATDLAEPRRQPPCRSKHSPCHHRAVHGCPIIVERQFDDWTPSCVSLAP